MSSAALRASVPLAVVLCGFVVAESGAAPVRSLDAVLASAYATPAELEVEAELAAARRLVAASSRNLADGISLAVAAGARRDRRAGDGAGDVAVEVEAPLLAGGGSRDAMVAALAAAERILPAAARRAGRAELEALYAEAWAAGEMERLSRSAFETAERGLALTRARVGEGAEAPFQAELAAIELRQAELAWRAAEAHRVETWGELRTRAALPPDPELLEAPRRTDAGPSRAAAEDGLVRRAIAARAALAIAGVKLALARERSRWSLRSELAREGDEEVGRVGLGYRVPRRDERAAAHAEEEARIAMHTREAELARERLASRHAAASALLLGSSGDEAARAGAAAERTAVEQARAALEALIVAGKARQAEVMPLRRQLFAAEAFEVERRAAVARALAELSYLQAEVAP